MKSRDPSEKVIHIFELLAYLASSARGLLEEPREYGPLRCLDAMRRLIDVVLEMKLVEDPEVVKYLQELKDRLQRGMITLMYNVEEFKNFIIDLNRELAKIAVLILEKYYSSE
jgi:hypothetical protein